jgi:Transglycosylase
MNRPLRPLRIVTVWLLALATAGLLLATALATVAWRATAARADQWALRLRADLFGRAIEHDASVAVLARLATHPLARPLLDGRRLRTAQGLWLASARADGTLALECAPCSLALPALGPSPLTVERAEVVVNADGADRYHGTLQVGRAPHVLQLDWRGRFDNAGRQFQIDAALPHTPLAHVVHALGRDLPERDRVRVGGTLALTLDARWPQGPWRLKPQVDAFSVEGLGTERLADLQRPVACRVDAQAGVPTLDGWLPRAVIAAEDQRFMEHPGYDLAAMVDAWQHNQRPGAPLVGASTLTQQLAKITYVGDERSASRKLRELLYAVEMERTLGKARILQLYLALAPWGDGVCGAERAVRVHLGQRDASTVGPVAAAWLASLLPAPDAYLRAEQARGEVDHARVERVLEAIRPMRPERREKALAQLPYWSPPAIGAPRPPALTSMP